MAARPVKKPSPARAPSGNPSEREVLWGGPSGPGLVWVVGETTRNIETLSVGLAKNTEAIGALAKVQGEHAQMLESDKQSRLRDENSRRSQQAILRNAVIGSAGVVFTFLVVFFAWAESVLSNFPHLSLPSH